LAIVGKREDGTERLTRSSEVEQLRTTCLHQQMVIDRLLASQDRHLGLIEQQNELLWSIERASKQRLEAATSQSISLDHENVELRRQVRDLEARLARTSDAEAAAPLPF
jgi:hypothetical protein